MGRCDRPLIQTCACLLFLCCCLRVSPPALSPPPPSSPSRNPLAQKPFRSYPYFLPLPAPIAVQTPPRQCATVKGTMKLARYLRRGIPYPVYHRHPACIPVYPVSLIPSSRIRRIPVHLYPVLSAPRGISSFYTPIPPKEALLCDGTLENVAATRARPYTRSCVERRLRIFEEGRMVDGAACREYDWHVMGAGLPFEMASSPALM